MPSAEATASMPKPSENTAAAAPIAHERGVSTSCGGMRLLTWMLLSRRGWLCVTGVRRSLVGVKGWWAGAARLVRSVEQQPSDQPRKDNEPARQQPVNEGCGQS